MYSDQVYFETESEDENEGELENEEFDGSENDELDELNEEFDADDIYKDEHVWDTRENRFRFRSDVWCSFEDELYTN